MWFCLLKKINFKNIPCYSLIKEKENIKVVVKFKNKSCYPLILNLATLNLTLLSFKNKSCYPLINDFPLLLKPYPLNFINISNVLLNIFPSDLLKTYIIFKISFHHNFLNIHLVNSHLYTNIFELKNQVIFIFKWYNIIS